MYDVVNTKNGRYGFIATYPDGEKITEFDVYWDQVSKCNKIQSLSIYDVRQSTTLVELTGYDFFYFSNEALSVQTNDWSFDPVSHIITPETTLTAKIIGGCNPGRGAIEIRLDVRKDHPIGTKLEYPDSQIPFAPHALRPGLGRAF